VSLSGACILLRREAFEQVNGFDERFFLYAEDIDLCLRLRQAGWSLRYEADAIVEHDRGASSATTPVATALHYRHSQLAFYRKHRGVLATQSLRLYLAFHFVIRRLFARGEEKRKLAADLLRCTLREPDR
jgi:GT2 family glycosyltransferase